jgi:uncharacterized protein (DUF1015 family)
VDNDASPCPYDGCDFDESNKIESDLIIHLTNNHTESGETIPPIVPRDMAFWCKNCEKMLYSRTMIIVS